MEEEKAHRRRYGKDIAFQKICRWCAFQERSQQEVRDKLYSFGLHERDVEEVIARLISENFINEERFAVSYAGGKFRQLGWGRIKIKTALQLKKVSAYCIRKALSSIGDDEYAQKLQQVLRKRAGEEKEKNPLLRNHRIARFAVSRGFEPDLVWEVLQLQDRG